MKDVNVLNSLEDQLKYLWSKTKQAKSQAEFVKARAEALKVYSELKRTKQFLGVI